jgi:hypothetical protein
MAFAASKEHSGARSANVFNFRCGKEVGSPRKPWRLEPIICNAR